MTFDEAARRYAQQLTDNDEYRRSWWRERKKVEALFAELKMLLRWLEDHVRDLVAAQESHERKHSEARDVREIVARS